MGRMGDKMHLRTLAAFVATAALAACSAPEAREASAETDTAAIEQAAHGSFVDAINSNDTETLMGVLTDDVAFQYPGTELVGKDAVREWVQGYYDAYTTRWEKTSHGFTVDGDTAWERYSYKATDTDKATGEVTTDTGKGMNVYRRGEDGKWRVALDGWSSDKVAGEVNE